MAQEPKALSVTGLITKWECDRTLGGEEPVVVTLALYKGDADDFLAWASSVFYQRLHDLEVSLNYRPWRRDATDGGNK